MSARERAHSNPYWFSMSMYLTSTCQIHKYSRVSKYLILTCVEVWQVPPPCHRTIHRHPTDSDHDSTPTSSFLAIPPSSSHCYAHSASLLPPVADSRLGSTALPHLLSIILLLTLCIYSVVPSTNTLLFCAHLRHIPTTCISIYSRLTSNFNNTHE
jgi:hypothetical protein